MADRAGLEETWRRAMEANLAYYQGLAQLGLGYIKSLADIVAEVAAPTLQRGSHRHAAPAATGEAAKGDAPTDRAASAGAPAMVLEAEAGNEALGVFLVGNRLDRKVSAPVSASSFIDPAGREVTPPLRLEPEVMTLEPGEQMLVRVTARIGEELEPGVSYRGEVSVPELSGGRVPLVLRRRTEPAAGDSRPARPKPAGTAKKPQARTTRTARTPRKAPGTRTGRTRAR